MNINYNINIRIIISNSNIKDNYNMHRIFEYLSKIMIDSIIFIRKLTLYLLTIIHF